MNILKISKRITAVLLVLTMVFSMLPMQAFATEEESTDTPTAVTVTGVALDQYALALTAGGSAVLTATVSPEEVSDKRVTWTSDNEAVATVADGTVTAVAEGTANITATTAAGGHTAVCSVTVSPAQPEAPGTPDIPEVPGADTIAVTGISLGQDALSVPLGGYSTLTYTIAPENATNQNVLWSSSDESVATVTDGQVTGVAEGTATITIITEDGSYSASVTATVAEIRSPFGRSSVTVTEIATAEALAAIEPAVSGSYKLIADIELPSNWMPKNLGAYQSDAQIIFDGNGHTVTLNSTALFAGVYTPCIVKNLVIKGNVCASGAVGAIATSLSGTIINCISYADVVSTDNNAGGLVGTTYEGANISNCAALGNVSSESSNAAAYAIYAGRNWGATAAVVNCYWMQDIAASENDNTKTGKKDSTTSIIEAINTANTSDNTLTYWILEDDSDDGGVVEAIPELSTFSLMSSNTNSSSEVATLNFDSATTVYDVTLSNYSTSYAYISTSFSDGLTATYSVGDKSENLTSGTVNQWFNFGEEGTATTLTVTVSNGTDSKVYTFHITRPTRPLEDDNSLGVGWGGIVVKYGSAYTQTTVYQANASGTDTENTTQSNDHKYYAVLLPEGETSFVVTASATGSEAGVRYRVNDGQWETWGNYSAPSKTTPAKVEIQIISEKEYYSGTEGWDGKTVNSFTLWVKTEGAAEPPRLTGVNFGSSVESFTFDPEVLTYDLIATQGYIMGGSASAAEGYTVSISPSLGFLGLHEGTTTTVTITVTDTQDETNFTVYTFHITKYADIQTALGTLTVPGVTVVHATDQGVVQEGTAITEQQKHYAVTVQDNSSSFPFTASSVKDASWLRYRAAENSVWSEPVQGTLTETVTIDMNSRIAVEIQISSDSAFTSPNLYTLWATRGTPASNATWEGSGTEADPYLLKTPEDLEALRNQTNAGNSFSGIYFRMANDITLPAAWTVIGTSSHPFSGNLDGNNKTLTVPEGGKPLLGYVSGASVKNLNIYGTRINGYGLVDNFVGFTNTTGITLDAITLKAGSSTLRSGLLGSYITSNEYAGCAAGFVADIKNCVIESNVVIGYDRQQSHIGAIAGRVSGTITNCVSSATVYGADYVGGIVGMKDNSMAALTVSGCTFNGTVSASGTHAGGIVGGDYGHVSGPNGIRMKLKNNTNSGSITGADKVGGILGGDSVVLQSWDNSSISEITGNTSTGAIRATGGTYEGGIIGYYHSLNKYDNFSGNTYSGTTKGIGFVQYVDTSCTTHETASGTIYFNTAEALPGITVDGGRGGVTKRNHNRTDDPLGADAEDLARSLDAQTPAAPTVTRLTVDTSKCTLRYDQGENYNLTGAVFTAIWSDGTATNPKLSEVTVTGYDPQKSGTQTLTATYEGAKCYITVNVIAAPVNTTITVTFSMLGDSAHGESGSVHTLRNGGLTTWISATQYSMASGSTVLDLLAKACGNNGISYAYSGGFVSSVTRGGVTLAAFTNGPNSGWMYTINGSHSDYNVSEQKLSSGDVVVFHYTDDYNIEYGSSSSGSGTVTQKTDAEKVMELIKQIGAVSYTSACKQKIDAARAAYAALSAADKSKVTNVATLEAAEKTYQDLKKLDDQKQADAVDALINKIKDPITLNSASEINAARTAYDKLTEEQQALVRNLQRLREAEAALASLKATEEDKEKAQTVMDLIEQIGEVTVDSEEKIQAARTAYDKLTDLQKALVTNLDVLEAAETAFARLEELDHYRDTYETLGAFLEKQELPIGSDWIVLGLIRSGYEVEEDYGKQLLAYIRENADEDMRLHRAKSSDNSRTILTLTALGYDATAVEGINLVAGLNSMDYIYKQGINGAFWALIALDCGNYPAPGGEVTRENLCRTIVDARLSDGGWALSGETSDPDMTGMALQALAPYYDAEEETASDVNQAVDAALAYLSRIQNSDGSFSTGNAPTAESCAQVILALTALGIDPDTDERFIKDGASALDALLKFYVPGEGFRHMMDGGVNGVATEQAYAALTAYDRFLNDRTRLYDMTDVLDLGGGVLAEEKTEAAAVVIPEEEPAPEKPGFFQWLFSGIRNLFSWFKDE